MAVAPFLWVALSAGLALARPGGGQHFSGGSHSSHSSYSGHSSSSGGGDSFIFDLLFWLLFGHPLFGLPVLLVVAFVLWRILKQQVAQGGLEVGPGSEGFAPPPLGPGGLSARRQIQALRADDPGFSLPLFEDFLAQLYVQTQELRGARQLDRLAPYLSSEVRRGLAAASSGLTEVKDVIVGGLSLVSVSGLTPPALRVRVQVRFETNATEVAPGKAQDAWQVEVWTLERNRGAKSRPKGPIELLRCPSCGAPFDGVRGPVCGYCKQTVDTGEFDWVTTAIEVLERAQVIAPDAAAVAPGLRPPPDSFPTVVDPDGDQGLAALQASDPAFDWQAFAERVGLVFSELELAWSQLKWDLARPYVTDNFYKAQLYWIDRYRKTHRRNVTENAQLDRVELVSCTSDAAYDSLTLRVWAQGLDYTLDEASGQVVEGSRDTPQAYSEYWTFLRGRGVTGRASAERTCPSCGAPIAVNMAGDCAHCRAHLTSGDFDWVLSRIEQDSVYQ